MVRANKGMDPDMHRGIKTSYMLLNASLEGSDQVFLNLSADGHYAIVGTYTYWHV